MKALVVPDAKSRTVRLLDVGSGPVTTVGKVWTGYQLEVTAIDPLADAYAELYLGVVPPSRPMKVDGERLTSALPTNHFDIVYSKNAIDHAYNAPQVLREMVAVVKPGGVVVILVNENVAESEKQWGLHQWNFEAVPRSNLLHQPHQPARDAFVFDGGESVPARFSAVLWNAHGRQRLAPLLQPLCAHVERIVVRQGYRQYAARYLELIIRTSPALCVS